jgi:hypothetical protein
LKLPALTLCAPCRPAPQPQQQQEQEQAFEAAWSCIAADAAAALAPDGGVRAPRQ